MPVDLILFILAGQLVLPSLSRLLLLQRRGIRLHGALLRKELVAGLVVKLGVEHSKLIGFQVLFLLLCNGLSLFLHLFKIVLPLQRLVVASALLLTEVLAVEGGGSGKVPALVWMAKEDSFAGAFHFYN